MKLHDHKRFKLVLGAGIILGSVIGFSFATLGATLTAAWLIPALGVAIGIWCLLTY